MRWVIFIPGVVVLIAGIIMSTLGAMRVVPYHTYFLLGGVAPIVAGVTASIIGSVSNRSRNTGNMPPSGNGKTTS